MQTLQTLLGETQEMVGGRAPGCHRAEGQGCSSGQQYPARGKLWEMPITRSACTWLRDSLWKRLSQAPLFNLCLGVCGVGGAVTLQHDPLLISTMVGECMEGLELVCGLERGGRGAEEEEGRI